MRRILLLLVFCFILLCVGCSLREESGKKDSVTAPAVTDGETETGGAVSDAPETVAGVMMGETGIGKRKNKEKRTVRTITDPNGKKRKLKMGKVNIKNEGVKFCVAIPPSEYAQVYDGHYYYLRSDGFRNYTIYRDKGKMVGQFSLKNGYVGYFTKYGSDFYAIIYDQYIYKTKKDWEAVEYPEIGIHEKLAYIDLKKKEAVLLRDVKGFWDCCLYENSFIYKNEKTEGYEKSSITDEKTKISLPTPGRSGEYKLYYEELKLVDGKWYFGTTDLYDEAVTLWSLDLKSWKREKLICYELKKRKFDGVDFEDVFLGMDNDYIYTMDYIIPLTGGKMIKLPGRVWGETVCSNKKYIFYIDEKFRIHRFCKKNMNHTIINGIQAVNIRCTDNCIYVAGYNKKYYGNYFGNYLKYKDEEEPESDDGDIYTEEADANDEDEYFDKEDLIDYSRKKAKRKLKVNNKENPDSFDLYCMDLDGNHRTRLWKGKIK